MVDTKKIIDLLRIPFERIVIFPEYIEIIHKDQNVGSLIYFNVNSEIIYDNSESVVNKFRWDYIYFENQEDIKIKIYDFLNVKEKDILITLGTFRYLYVKNLDDSIFVKCYVLT
ncbi:hypothetical protein [Flavobacterium sp. B17]|uniref:hypothetical protein n=1 Tax=Flavobacterium sp. B17 TaxID=95618 RepID=UPI0003485467|nr:hypothetical protein [Flavobacterium sp. B17]